VKVNEIDCSVSLSTFYLVPIFTVKINNSVFPLSCTPRTRNVLPILGKPRTSLLLAGSDMEEKQTELEIESK